VKKHHILKIVIMATLALILSTGAVFCQDPSQLRINLELKDTPVRNAIEALFKGTGLNISWLQAYRESFPVSL
jgi:hypothetical protein